MSEITTCPNCKASLKSGVFSSNEAFGSDSVKIINEYHDVKSDAYCNKCGGELLKKYTNLMTSEKKRLGEKLKELFSSIPVVSTHSPFKWDYEVIDMVTGQSTTGTGVITEFTSSFTDLFGVQSGRHNEKLKVGEDLCFAQLRRKTLDLGGNAVIGTDIDYSEVGGNRGMLMVCMAGTSVNLKNTEVLGKDRSERIDEIKNLNSRFQHLSKFKIVEYWK